MESRRGRYSLEKLRLIKRGAESNIYEGYFLGIRAIFKQRIKKSYRNPELDHKINYERTILEAKIIYTALKNDMNVPAVLFIDPNNYLLVIEYIEGEIVKDLINTNNSVQPLSKIGERIGELTGKLHSIGIAHGDLTTNNLILSSINNDIFIIDFGLSRRTQDEEDLATDFHIFLRSLESIHSDFKDIIYNSFVEGYRTIMGGKTDEILELVKDIRMRGRYVEERRKNRSGNE
ncbi:Mn2+-dependent serine/threonine protein kinase [Sulfolobus islandicus Y.N.15.51]|uniref:non-specific serine/threonine protein kinase n=1 Tax=Saccharolobus islandicus (strain Y.N.15.51 / Yellowstone \|nr:Kae1-associated kinase Bud32 [Sulfolobus islandicus]ACP48242.1 Mn2+-dependent serine/threonine protein kinase [Sulfolobus islandicus Y.N.15.51]